MRSTESTAATRGAALGVKSGWLLFGMFATALLLMVPRAQMFAPYRVVMAPQAFSRLIARQAPTAPSVFETEQTLGPKALLDRWNPLVAEASQRFHVPAAWIRAVMQRESGGRTLLGEGKPIVSAAGAMGLMQVMPGTYAELRQQYRLGADPHNPRDNVMAGAAYLRWLRAKYGYPAMFAAYNTGPGNYNDHLLGRGALPRETRNYVKAIAQYLGDKAVTLASAQAKLTRPDGTHVIIDPTKVSAVRAVVPGEYDPSVHAVVTMGRLKQAVREEVATTVTRLRQNGARI